MKAREIAEFVGGELYGDGDVEITSIADISKASAGQLAFFEKVEGLPETNASCMIVPIVPAETRPVESMPVTLIQVKNPKLAFAKVSAILHPSKKCSPETNDSALISPSAILAEQVFIGAIVCIGDKSSVGEGSHLRAGAKVGDGVTIGKNCVLHPNVFVEDGCTIGDHVTLHSGVVIGADGFGYVRDDEGNYHKFPQIGTVVIEDNVEIGANTCIDRGALGETRIGEGTKIDNLVQVGHNVQIGKRCVIAAQTGIS
ncbi:MAG TPA: UDP-3-O-(3-hydroxymyristoyl)glucosamine N-acyltransferase, partial [Pyrinomonadaceae bacterium]|nr:UDP-3-O-(3-hydroxymyristoyl)glucosamine N-acyltransferase [Pyrinomonadaceae bacterium]